MLLLAVLRGLAILCYGMGDMPTGPWVFKGHLLVAPSAVKYWQGALIFYIQSVSVELFSFI